MKRIITSEIVKAKNMRLILFFLLYFIISLLYLYVVLYISVDLLANDEVVSSFFTFFIKYNLVFSEIFFGILTIININSDLKKNIFAKQFISGYSKDLYIFEKLFYILITSFLMIIIEIVKFSVLQITFLHHFDFSAYFIFKLSVSYFIFFNIIGLFSFLISATIQNTILASVIFYIIYKVDSIINIYESMKYGTVYGKYLPFKSAENIVQNIIAEPKQIIATLFYIVLSLFLIFHIINKKEIILNK